MGITDWRRRGDEDFVGARRTASSRGGLARTSRPASRLATEATRGRIVPGSKLVDCAGVKRTFLSTRNTLLDAPSFTPPDAPTSSASAAPRRLASPFASTAASNMVVFRSRRPQRMSSRETARMPRVDVRAPRIRKRRQIREERRPRSSRGNVFACRRAARHLGVEKAVADAVALHELARRCAPTPRARHPDSRPRLLRRQARLAARRVPARSRGAPP